MRNLFRSPKNFLLLIICFLFVGWTTPDKKDKKDKKDFYQVVIYNLKSETQVASVDLFLKDVYLPAVHRAGIKNIGVFKPIVNDTVEVKKIYVFMPFTSLQQWQKLADILEKDVPYQTASKTFANAAANKKPYERVESILLEAFPMLKRMVLPNLKNPLTQRVYELRSYESPTAHLHKLKVKMFNEGGEIALFNTLEFNAVFYSRVLSGSKMPNLMYMTTFENMEDRKAHWESFVNSAEWKRLSTLPEYENDVSVSRNEMVLMHPAAYSDF